MNRGSGRSYWNRRGGGGRSWNSRSSNDTPTNQNIDGERRLMNRSAGRSHNRRNYSSSNFRSNNRRYGPSIENFDTIEEIGERTSNSISIAIEGCCHGQLTAIYDRLRKYEEEDEVDTIERTFSSANDTSADAAMQITARQLKPKKKKIDLLICCGDFQSIRTPADFHSLAVPAKYREMGTFHKYYNEEWVAPILTIFCGGNHEASQPLSELYYGGWVAPKMYYLGAAGVVQYRGIRIGGLSGIFKSHDHYQSRNEIPPYDQKQVRSVYHYRNVDVYRLSCLRTEHKLPSPADHGHATTKVEASQQIPEAQPMRRLDIMVSHDWPQGIEQYGDVNDLVRRKPFFRQEINENSLGSPPAAHLLHTLQPLYWFAAHLHVKFHAKVVHRSVINVHEPNVPSSASISETNDLIPSQVFQAKIRNSSVIAKELTFQAANEPKDPPNLTATNQKNDGDTNETPLVATNSITHFVVPESSSCQNPLSDLTEQMTQFLSLDKCLPRRQYLSILHLPIPGNCDSENDACNDAKLEYDLEWLAIIRKTHHLAASSHPQRVQLPQVIQSNGGISCPHHVTAAEIAWVKERVGDDMTIPENFTRTLSQKYDEQSPHVQPPPLLRMGNPQTDRFLDLLELEHLPNLTIPFQESSASAEIESSAFDAGDDNEIDLDDDIDPTIDAAAISSTIFNDDVNEIDVDDNVSSAVVQSDDTLLSHDVKKPRIMGGSE